ncbi:MAG: site-specific integrase [Clostridia bacterium]|nr:site-specific integrase [Clostridia bacterium]
MATKLLEKSEWTKDGRKWIFYDYVKNLDGTRRKYKSKKFFTKNEALQAEREFLLTNDINIDKNRNMTFKELYILFYKYKEDKVKFTTLKTYKDREKFFRSLYNIKLKNFTIEHFELWKKEINSYGFSTTHKNHIYKLFKQLLNYATKWYDFNFMSIYNKMTNFTDPNERPKEMLFYTFDEFQQFISVEKDILFKTIYETFYYCGLRRGELKGLTWEDIDFDKKILRVNKNIVSIKSNEGKSYIITTPKTKSSVRQIPIANILLDDLKKLYSMSKNKSKFTKKWFVFGDNNPITSGKIRIHKNKNCKLSGVKQIRIHDFRHSCASLLINNNANVTLVAKYLGHAKIDETLNTYSHLYKSQMDEIINIIDNLF